MRIETKQDEIFIQSILKGFAKSRLHDATLTEALDILKALDCLKKSLAEYVNPPKLGVPSGPENAGNKVVPMRIPRGKKK